MLFITSSLHHISPLQSCHTFFTSLLVTLYFAIFFSYLSFSFFITSCSHFYLSLRHFRRVFLHSTFPLYGIVLTPYSFIFLWRFIPPISCVIPVSASLRKSTLLPPPALLPLSITLFSISPSLPPALLPSPTTTWINKLACRWRGGREARFGRGKVKGSQGRGVPRTNSSHCGVSG